MYEITAEKLIENLKNYKYGHKNGERCLPLHALKITELAYGLFKSILRAICNPKNDLSEIITTLDVSHNALEKLPKTIGVLNKLKMLNISDNQLQGIPDFNDCLLELEGFDASGNQLQTLPASLYDLPKLSFLNVDNNPLDANTRENIQVWQARWPQAEQKSVLDIPRSMSSSLTKLNSKAKQPEPIPSVELKKLSFSEKYAADCTITNGDAKLAPETTEQERDSDHLKDTSSDATTVVRVKIA